MRNKTFTVSLIVIGLLLLSFSSLVDSKDIVSIKETDFSLKEYNEKAIINEVHVMNIEYSGKEILSKDDISYRIVGDAEDISEFNRCVDIGYDYIGNTISFTGKVKKWGVYSVDIQPVIKNSLTLSKYAWWNSSWTYVKTIGVNGSQLQTNLYNHVVLVNLSDGDLQNNVSLANGSDIWFVNQANNSVLLYEIEKFDNTSGQLVAWVKLPQINKTGLPTTCFNMYYGNPDAFNNESSTTVWSSYITVHHLDDKTTSTTDDSVDNYDGNKHGANEPIETTSGIIGDAQSFDGTDDDISMGDVNEMDAATEITMSIWYYADTLNTDDCWIGIVGKIEGVDSKDKVALETYPQNGRIAFSVANGDYGRIYKDSMGEVETGVWHHLCGVYDASGDASADKLKLYVDGNAISGSFIGAIPASSDSNVNHLIIARPDNNYDSYPNNYLWWDGKLDEFRFAEDVLNASQINADYNMVNNASVEPLHNPFLFVSVQKTNEIPEEPTPSDYIPSLTIVNPENNSVDFCPCSNSFCVEISHNTSNMNLSIAIVNHSSYNYVNVTNNTFCLCISNYTLDTVYSWYANVSVYGNTSAYNYSGLYMFTTVDVLSDCSNSIGDNMEITIGAGLLGIILTLVLILIAFKLDEEEKKNIWKPIILFLDVPIALATGIYYIGNSANSILYWIGIIMFALAIILSFAGLYYGLNFGRK